LVCAVSEGGPPSSSYAESYEPFISDYPSSHQHHEQSDHHHHSHNHPSLHGHHHSHQHLPMGCSSMGGVMSSPHGGGGGSSGQCSPGCPCSGGPYMAQLSGGGDLIGGGGGCHTSSHPGDYGWDEVPCDPGDYSMFLHNNKGDSPTTSGESGGVSREVNYY